MTAKEIKQEEIIYQIIMKGKDIQIRNVIAYPASGLNSDERYLVTISRIGKGRKN